MPFWKRWYGEQLQSGSQETARYFTDWPLRISVDKTWTKIFTFVPCILISSKHGQRFSHSYRAFLISSKHGQRFSHSYRAFWYHQNMDKDFHIRTVHFDIIKTWTKIFTFVPCILIPSKHGQRFSHSYRAFWYHQSYLFTNECTSDCLKNNIKIFIKIAPTCFGVVTPSSGSSLSVL